MLHHFITKYWNEDNKCIVESWLQLDIPFTNWCWCFSKRRIEIDKRMEL